MSLIIVTIFLIVILKIAYDWYKFYVQKSKLKWMRNIPGWPVIGFALEFGGSSETIATFERLVKQNGKLAVGHVLTKIEVIVTDYEFLEFVLSSTTILTKSSFYKFLLNWLGTGLLTSDGAKWKQRRKLITPAFHFSVLRSFVKVFEKNVDILLKKLEKETDKECTDIYPLVTLCALDIICETAMGVTVEAQKYEDSKYVKNVKKMCRIGVERSSSLTKTNDYLYLLTPDYYREKQAVKELHNVTNSIIESRMSKLKDSTNVKLEADDTGRKDKLTFLDILLKSTVEGQPLSKEDIREEVDTFMFEGHDTISSAMSFALYLLSKHPKVQNRVLEEQKQIFADDFDRPVTYEDLQEMKYLECVIKETLRLYPSVPLFGRQVTEDITYKGNLIPKNTNITIFCYGILRDPENYTNPDEFIPDRFETADGKKPYSFIPFSAGPRNCIGQKFAMLEIKTTLSKILRNFELLPATNQPEMILLSEAVLKSKNGVHLLIS